MKICIKCKIEKDQSEYYKHSGMKNGYLNKCKECCKGDTKSNYQKNKVYYAEYDRLRLDDEKRKAAKKEYSRKLRITNPGKVLEYHRKYDKNKKAASGKLNKALFRKEIIKKPCVICGNEKSEGHHDNYENPLSVVWLCRKHHGMAHRKAIKQGVNK